MSINTAIDSALSGMNAEANKLSAISSNVANSSTVGYKASETDFESLVLGSGSNGTTAGGVAATNWTDVSSAGQIQSTGVSTDLAVNGQGFFVVSNNATSGAGNYLLTQAGSFRPDASGNLVNAAGYYLQGQPIPASGVAGGVPQNMADLSTVNVANLTASATPTTAMTYAVNLPSNDTAYSATPPAPSSSSAQYYDGLGTQQTLTFDFTPTTAATANAPPTNTWTMNIYDSASATPTTPVGTATLVFAGTGPTAGELQSVTPTAGTYNPNAGTFSITTGSGATLPINIGAIGSPEGMTQLDGPFNTTNVTQNGSSFGTAQGVTISTDGIVTATFSNGATRPIYQLDLANVSNPDGLIPADGGAFQLSPAAGIPRLYQAGTGPVGTTEGGALEGSNVDLSTELTNLIATQNAYSSAGQVIQAANQMLQVVSHLNL
ncbi:MAG: flagellar hook protein FlgE [Acetobacteraceae bacterium]|jgi:flagellar hook protein FlgE